MALPAARRVKRWLAKSTQALKWFQRFSSTGVQIKCKWLLCEPKKEKKMNGFLNKESAFLGACVVHASTCANWPCACAVFTSFKMAPKNVVPDRNWKMSKKLAR